jgi:hypothetical protein
MQQKNLLLSSDDIYDPGNNCKNNNISNKMYADIDSGTVYQKAKKEILKNANAILCPIIFS